MTNSFLYLCCTWVYLNLKLLMTINKKRLLISCQLSQKYWWIFSFYGNQEARYIVNNIIQWSKGWIHSTVIIPADRASRGYKGEPYQALSAGIITVEWILPLPHSIIFCLKAFQIINCLEFFLAFEEHSTLFLPSQ